MIDRRLWAMAAPLLLFADTVFSQAGTNATCLAGSEWMNNAKGQSPCLVSAYLSAQCNNGQWLVPALVTQGPYNPPSGQGANQCRCNTVVYSLLSACSACQNGLVGTWSTWIQFCPPTFVTVADYPLAPPVDTEIPKWALVDPSKTGAWNVTEAQAIATSAKKSSGGSNTGAIAGGVVGGVAGLALIGALAFLWHRRRQEKGDKVTPVPYGDPGFSATYQPEKSVPPRTDLGTPAPFLPAQTPAPFKPYDPTDPSTFPSAMSAGFDTRSVGHSTGHGSPSPGPNTTFQPYQDYPQPQYGGPMGYSGTPPPMQYPPRSPPPPRQPGGYTGAAEL
ncbi:hypothetical protein FRC03_009806 [Tulasnella sp. 419]|nr:hypothetical protein FRC03_009806 [Tulasnella sp. 419]